MFFKLLHPKAECPARQTPLSAGYDLKSVESYALQPHQRKLISTGLAMALEDEDFQCYGQVASRSSLAVKGIDIGAGVIDQDYRGEIKVLMINHSDNEFVINEGDRIAQLIIIRNVTPTTYITSQLPKTIRGEKGFGSTGV